MILLSDGLLKSVLGSKTANIDVSVNCSKADKSVTTGNFGVVP